MQSFAFYSGPSLITPDTTIAAIATQSSDNRKTGDILQTWIMPTAVTPPEAVRTGIDRAVCGDCRYRPSIALRPLPPGAPSRPRCYVNTGQAPLSIHGAFTRGRYDAPSPETLHTLTRGRIVRLGSWGDPYAVPLTRWLELTQDAAGHRGYTHGWRHLTATATPRDLTLWQRLLMASVDTLDEWRTARAAGWRTFRVSTTPGDIQPGEVICPASREGGYKATCETCTLCAGTAAQTDRTVVILDHSAGWRNRLIPVATD